MSERRAPGAAPSVRKSRKVSPGWCPLPARIAGRPHQWRSRGIRAALAGEHRTRGDTVIVADPTPVAAGELHLDVRDAAAYADLAGGVLERHGRIDVFHNNTHNRRCADARASHAAHLIGSWSGRPRWWRLWWW